jgi:adenosylhomocysteine nucleosidase
MPKTAIVVGMQSEANIVGNPDNAVVIIGAGDAAKLASDLADAINGGCDRVLSFGTCGALNPKLKAGEIVVGTAADGSFPIMFDLTWTDRLVAQTNGTRVVVTGAKSTVAIAAQKADLFADSGADVVDLETCIAALFAWIKCVPFAMLRAVSDTADQDIPPAALAALNSGGGVDVWAVVDSLVGDAKQLPALIRLANSSTLAFNALAMALADIGINYGASP